MRLELLDPYAPEAARIWSELPARSFFTSWGWMENWLACLPADRAPRMAVLHDGAPVAACFLGRRFELRRTVIPTRGYHLNTTGVHRLDDILVEYNGMVGRDLPLARFIEILPEPWDELLLPALDETAFGGVREETHRGWRSRIERRVPVFTVDLATVRRGGYLEQLSGSTRSQVRRAQRLAGTLQLEIAGDEAHAIAIYDELCALHTAQWRAKGQPGAFADPWFDRFHRRLISERFRAGEIQLVRVRAAGATIGCLYNFIWRDRVLQYQTGLAMSADSRHKPGYVCHTAAIEHAARAGLEVYDFLAGDHRYKRSLSTGSGWLLWCKVQRVKLRFTLEDQLVKLARAIRARQSSQSGQ